MISLHNHSRHPPTEPGSPGSYAGAHRPAQRATLSPLARWTIIGGAVLGGGVALWQLGVSPAWVLLGACVLLHPLMHAGHGGHGGSK